MKVWMAASSQGNPYIDLLVRHLERRGVGVRGDVEPQDAILRDLVERGPPDVMHLHWLNVFFLRDRSRLLELAHAAGGTASFLGVLSALKAAGTTIVWTAHNLHNHDRRMELADATCHGAVARSADAIVAHSEYAQQRVLEAFEIDEPRKVHVVPHGHYLDSYPDEVGRDEARRRLGIDPDERMVLFVGRIRRYKNVPRLIRAFARSRGRDRERLVVAGAADDELADEIRAAGADVPSVDLHLRFLEDEELQYFLNAADAVALPYREILTSGSAVLAMSFGRPVVAPRQGTIRDVVGRGGGFLYDPEAPEGLQGALRAALDADVETLRAVGERNLRRARGWSWERVASRTLETYEWARD